ncbi:metallophosphoesterase [Streptomyces millisiae]|uniref:Metallophosphoesterase n=1 Tax=Streptomyces millisiae TaxID=3075542 RepID=A0ABU2LPC4_9ACTN|nr:metallophosphoesterase [Streptomyces sp. DSM 44918]MDT0319433.1 metallophosphoesterase [Streptomyces sp. DSM 44918]
MGFGFVAVLLVLVVVVHWYLWLRLVRDVSRPGGWYRRVGTALLCVLPATSLLAILGGRLLDLPFPLIQVLAWPGNYWYGSLLYILLTLAISEAVRPFLLRGTRPAGGRVLAGGAAGSPGGSAGQAGRFAPAGDGAGRAEGPTAGGEAPTPTGTAAAAGAAARVPAEGDRRSGTSGAEDAVTASSAGVRGEATGSAGSAGDGASTPAGMAGAAGAAARVPAEGGLRSGTSRTADRGEATGSAGSAGGSTPAAGSVGRAEGPTPVGAARTGAATAPAVDGARGGAPESGGSAEGSAPAGGSAGARGAAPTPAGAARAAGAPAVDGARGEAPEPGASGREARGEAPEPGASGGGGRGGAPEVGPQDGVESAASAAERGRPSRRLVVARGIAVATGVVTAGFMGYGTYAARRLVTRRVSVTLPRLPSAADGYRVAVVSDIHLGPLLGRAHCQRVVDTINRTRPHLVTVVGDLVDAEVDDLRSAVAPLAGIESRDGVYYVTGNHEYNVDTGAWVDHVRELGLRPLANARDELPHFDLAGVNDVAGEGTDFGGPDFEAALGDRDPSRVSVLMAHQPVQIHDAVEYGVDLQLSGHTHGGQMWPLNYVAAAANPTLAGLDRYGDTQLYVTRGAGAFGPPVRIGADPDVTLIELRAG